MCFLAVWLFASLVFPGHFLLTSITAQVVFYYSYLFIQTPFPFVLQSCYRMEITDGPVYKGHMVGSNKGAGLMKPDFTGRKWTKLDKLRDAKAETPDARLSALSIDAYPCL